MIRFATVAVFAALLPASTTGQLFFQTTATIATEVHVAPGGIDGGTCGAAEPCATIGFALSRSDAHIVRLHAGRYDEHSISIGRNVSIIGAGRDLSIVDAGRQGRVFQVDAGVIADLRDLTVTGGRVATERGDDPEDPPEGVGGGITNRGDLTLRNVAVSDNEVIGAPGHDGARGVDGAGGSAGRNGRSIDCGEKRGNCADPAFGSRGNHGQNGANGAPGRQGGSVWGGALWSNGRLTVIDSVFAQNRAVGGTGGKGGDGGNGGSGGRGGNSAYVKTFGHHPHIPLIKANYCIGLQGGFGGDGAWGGHGHHGGSGGWASGGAIYAHTRGEHDVVIVNTQFLHNTAEAGPGGDPGKGGKGGAPGAAGKGGRTPSGCVQMPNSTSASGKQGIERRGTVGETGPAANPGGSRGGGFYTWNPGANVTIANVVVAANGARYGGGVAVHGQASIRHGTVVGNRADHAGGGISVNVEEEGAVQITNSLIWANTIGSETDLANNGFGGTIQIVRDGNREPSVTGSCIEGFGGPEATAGGNLDECADPGLDRPVWDEAQIAAGAPELVPALGSALIDAGRPDGVGTDPADLDGDGDKADALPRDIAGNARVFGYPFRVGGMAPRTTEAMPDIGAYEATVEVASWSIGRPIDPPSDAMANGPPTGQPEIQPIPARNRFYWDPVGQTLTPLAEYLPGPVSISWSTAGGALPAMQYGRPDWPDDALAVAAGAPIDLTVPEEEPLRFLAQGNILADDADYQPALAGLARGEARLVTLLPREARKLDEATPTFLVLRGAPAADLVGEEAKCTVGEPLVHSGHMHPVGLNGFVADPAAPVDMENDVARYDRTRLMGPIVPVNASAAVPDHPLVVAWYRKGRHGIHWPDLVVRYDCTWPQDAAVVIPGGETGVSLGGFSNPRVMHQPDRDAPGYLPNLAHATVANGPDGPHLHALRDMPDQHVVVRHVGVEGAPDYGVFRLGPATRSTAPQDHVIGRPLPPPAWLSHLEPQGCAESTASGPVHRDHTGTFWPTSPEDAVSVRWFYRIEPTMARDLDGDGRPELSESACTPWLADADGRPEPLVHRPRWPGDAEEIRVGASLDLDGVTSVELAHGASISARLLPLGRTLATELETVPAAAAPDRSGRLTGLPGTLADRLHHAGGLLQLRGGRSEGRFLINRLTARELDAAIAVAPHDDAWTAALAVLAAQSDEAVLVGARRLTGEAPILSTGAITDEGHVVLILDDERDAGTPVSVRVVRVACPAITAPVLMRRPTDLFDPGVTFEYAADFGGEAGRLSFEWRRRALENPAEIARPASPDADGWRAFPGSANLGSGSGSGSDGTGMDAVRIGPGDPGLLETTAVVARYRGFEDICGDEPTPWSGQEAGAPGRLPLPAAAKSWTSLVVERINPYDVRRTDLSEGAEATTTSLIALAGPRYEGAVQLGTTGALDAGLIEIYQTLLGRAHRLAFGDGAPAEVGAGASADIAQVAGRLAELYRALGDEAVADALDPSVVTDSEMGEERARASDLFAFAAFVPSRLEEELALLRGRSDATGTTRVAPWYNRLRWSTDTGEKTDAIYVSTYGIERTVDSGSDGAEEFLDYAKRLYPQGHGDAWGHYLSGIGYFYDLLATPGFTWAATVNLAEGSDGVVSLTASSEEEVFAKLALEKATTGARIADLQFRKDFRESQIDRLLGYPGSSADRSAGWSLAGWARRSGQGALFDWAALNAALPVPDCPSCPSEAETILRIDRGTVTDLARVPQAFERIQLTLDRANAGLTPLGLPQDIVPFGLDLDRRQMSKEGQFRQTYETSLEAVRRARAGLSRVELTLRDLRRTRAEESDRVREAAEREAEAKKALIDLYGAPYPEDTVGPGAIYPPGYDGPDIHNYDIVEAPLQEFFGSEFEIENLLGLEVRRVDALTEMFLDPTSTIIGREFENADVRSLMKEGEAYVIDDAKLAAFSEAQTARQAGESPRIRYLFAPELGGIVKPQRSGKRPKYGELQFARIAFLREFGQLRQQIREYDDLAMTIDEQLNRLEAKIRGQEGELATQAATLSEVEKLQGQMVTAELVQAEAEYAAQSSSEIAQIMANPGGGFVVGLTVASMVSRQVATVAQISRSQVQNRRERAEMTGQLRLIAGEAREYDLLVEAASLFETAQRHRILLEQLNQQELSVREAEMRYLSLLADAEREISALVRFRQETAADTRTARYADGVNRLLRDEAVAAYETQLDQAARHVYLAAKAYEYETGAYGFDDFDAFLGEILRKRSLGLLDQMGEPMAGEENGLIGMLGLLRDSFVSFEYNSDFPNAEETRLKLSLRDGLLRAGEGAAGATAEDRAILDELLAGVTDPDEIAEIRQAFVEEMAAQDAETFWAASLQSRRVDDLRAISAFRQCCLSARDLGRGPLPGLAVTFELRDVPRKNLFGQDRRGSDPILPFNASAHRIAAAAVVLEGFPASTLGTTPQVFLTPAGADLTRESGAQQARREWQVFDAKLPPVAAGKRTAFGLDLVEAAPRKQTSMRAFVEAPDYLAPSDMTTRLLGRSLENTRWLLVVPGEGVSLNGDPAAGLDALIGGEEPALQDIEIWFDVYSYGDGG